MDPYNCTRLKAVPEGDSLCPSSYDNLACTNIWFCCLHVYCVYTWTLCYICSLCTKFFFFFYCRRSLKRPRSVLPASSRHAHKRRHTTHVPHTGCEESQHVWSQHDTQQVRLGPDPDCGSVVSCDQAEEAAGTTGSSVVQRLDFNCAGHEQETAGLTDQLDHTPPTRRRRVIVTPVTLPALNTCTCSCVCIPSL